MRLAGSDNLNLVYAADVRDLHSARSEMFIEKRSSIIRRRSEERDRFEIYHSVDIRSSERRRSFDDSEFYKHLTPNGVKMGNAVGTY
jgi:hypothetical protein